MKLLANTVKICASSCLAALEINIKLRILVSIALRECDLRSEIILWYT